MKKRVAAQLGNLALNCPKHICLSSRQCLPEDIPFLKKISELGKHILFDYYSVIQVNIPEIKLNIQKFGGS